MIQSKYYSVKTHFGSYRGTYWKHVTSAPRTNPQSPLFPSISSSTIKILHHPMCPNSWCHTQVTIRTNCTFSPITETQTSRYLVSSFASLNSPVQYCRFCSTLTNLTKTDSCFLLLSSSLDRGKRGMAALHAARRQEIMQRALFKRKSRLLPG